MKKLVTAIALCVSISAFAVESANVVGYSTMNLEANKYKIVGVNFTGVGSSGIQLKDAIKGNFTSFDEILIRNASSTYDVYQYYAQDIVDDAIANEELPPGSLAGWYRQGVNNNNLVLTNGVSFWVRPKVSAVTVTAVGQVSSSNSTMTIKAGYNMCSLPFPVAVDINSCTYTGNAFDELLIQNASYTYDVYQYFTQAIVDDAIANEELPPGSLAGWYRSGVPGKTIPVGIGFWIRNKGVASVTFSMPTPL